MTINKIIKDGFTNDDGVPEEILILIGKFLEVEDTFSKGDSKDKMYEQILQTTLSKTEKSRREKMMKWCDEY